MKFSGQKRNLSFKKKNLISFIDKKCRHSKSSTKSLFKPIKKSKIHTFRTAPNNIINSLKNYSNKRKGINNKLPNSSNIINKKLIMKSKETKKSKIKFKY